MKNLLKIINLLILAPFLMTGCLNGLSNQEVAITVPKSTTETSSSGVASTKPATVVNLMAMSANHTDLTAVEESEKNVPKNKTVYIKWKITDQFDIPNGSIRLSYTTDDILWTEIVSGLDNDAGKSCSIDTGVYLTGCYRWKKGSPSNSYFRIKLEVINSGKFLTSSLSNSINTSSNFRNLAGNSDNGLNSSASGAVLFSYEYNNISVDQDSIVVDSSGNFYFNDYQRGLLKADASTGLLTVLIPTDASASPGYGDGGDYTQAKLLGPKSIALDYNDNLYVWDVDRIRKINFTTGKIHTIIGGGSDTGIGVTGAWDLQLCDPRSNGGYSLNGKTITMLPNGKIVFSRGCYANYTNENYYHYTPGANDALEGSVTVFKVTGTGTAADGAAAVAACVSYGLAHQFNTSTGAIEYIWASPNCGSYSATLLDTNYVVNNPNPGFTGLSYIGEVVTAAGIKSGMDGKIYTASRLYGTVNRYDGATNSWTKVLGKYYQNGACNDGTIATDCRTDVHDIFVRPDGKFYFLDRMGLRTIDDSGKVQTVFGLSKGAGNGGLSTRANFNKIESFDLWRDGNTRKLVVMDTKEYKMREAVVGGNISHLAGNGTNSFPNVGGDPMIDDLFISVAGPNWPEIAVHPTNGTVYFHSVTEKVYFDRKSDGTPNPWKLATTIPSGYYPGRTLAYDADSNKWLRAEVAWDGTNSTFSNVHLTVHEKVNGTWSYRNVVGSGDPELAAGGTICASGTAVSSCDLISSYNDGQYLGGNYNNGNWYIAQYNKKRLIKFSDSGTGNLEDVVTTEDAMIAFDYVPNSKILFYCNEDGAIKKVDYSVSPQKETTINIPIPGMKCHGRKMKFDPLEDSLIFIYEYNFMPGIGEIKNASSY